VARSDAPVITPGHTSVRISSGGENAVITGDMIHHPIQIAHPDWICEFRYRPEDGRRDAAGIRRALLRQAGDGDANAFRGPTSGISYGANGGFRFEG